MPPQQIPPTTLPRSSLPWPSLRPRDEYPIRLQTRCKENDWLISLTSLIVLGDSLLEGKAKSLTMNSLTQPRVSLLSLSNMKRLDRALD